MAGVRRSTGATTLAAPLSVRPLVPVKEVNCQVLLSGETVHVKARDCVKVPPVTETLTLKRPVVVGMPLMRPLVPLIARPGGSPAALYVRGRPAGPAAAICSALFWQLQPRSDCL